MKKNNLICIVGANASGKSSLGVRLCRLFNGEVISADSRQIYRGLDLGSGKMTAEEMMGIPHHLINVAEPGTMYPLFNYQNDAYAAIDGVVGRNRLPFLVGGTGLYIDAVAHGYQLPLEKPDSDLRRRLNSLSLNELTDELGRLDYEALNRVDQRNPRRLIRAIENANAGHSFEALRMKKPRYRTLMIGVYWDRSVLRERISTRLEKRISQGMVEEVEALLARGVPREFLISIGLEYRFIAMYLDGKFKNKEEFKDKLFYAICQFAKRQYTWFRKNENIKWFNGGEIASENVEALLKAFIRNFELEQTEDITLM